MARRAAPKRREQGAGSVRQLPSGRWQARYRDDEGKLTPAPVTFDTKLDASAWLDGAGPREVEEQRADPALTEWAQQWLTQREIKPRTEQSYRWLLRDHILPPLGDVRLSKITPARISDWHAGLDATKATTRARAYTLLSAMLRTAVDRELIDRNPCKVRRGSVVKRTHRPKVLTGSELSALVEAMPERYRAMTLLAAWCGLRFGELTELRRADVEGGRVHVTRAVVRVDGEVIVGEPKSEAGRRTVAVPPHVWPAVVAHLDTHVGPEPDALLFPARHGGWLAPASLYRVFYPARKAAGRPDLRWHDLRHHGATLAAQAGATLADLMARLGHSTPQAAMIYQHAAEERDAALAARMAVLAEQ
jgi:integrase